MSDLDYDRLSSVRHHLDAINKILSDNTRQVHLNQTYETCHPNDYSKLRRSISVKEEQVYESIKPVTKTKYSLPNGWLELEDERGKKYYACTYTKHTQWLHPNIPIGTLMSNGLTYGWDKDIDEEGEEYYINHVGRFNTRNPPVKRRKYLGSDYNW
jgi:hypothetical protein